MKKTNKFYPDSGVELSKFSAKHYDKVMNIASFGSYKPFIKKAIKDLDVKSNDKILDLGCGTGRNILLMNKYVSDNSLLTGLDISEDMEKQFIFNCKQFSNIKFINKRIDQPFDLGLKFDKVFISFVIHGFPHEIRKIIIKNAYNNLKSGGTFNILDFAEFEMNKMPFHHRFIFKKIECKYAFDFIKRDWKNILEEYGFDNFKETFYFKKYVRLLKAEKL
jgi:demethylmenaquinone methyltransferase/2-methoxy-6-polyprenyl-1,4-benzoquinol methylase